ncbi:MAG: nucleotidyltransferase family protein [Bacteroidaceae bacterium]|nr:nucleotidyltransferase family protein [Bacteroidaceae bacterium]
MTQIAQIFFKLVKAGLFGHAESTESTEKFSWDSVDWEKLYRMASEQGVIGLVVAGLDWFKVNGSRFTVPQALLLQMIGEVQMIEQRNKAMNAFIAELVEKMRRQDIYTLLVKGQGIAQCYDKPLWRASGDVDLFLSDTNYDKAKKLLFPLSSGSKPERQYSKEWGMNIGSWYVELHGTQRTGLSTRVDKEIDRVQRKVFFEGSVRSWMNGKTQVFLPGADEDVFFIFTHFVKHFYKEGGVSIRQLCDWCRLLYTYRESLNHGLLESRIKKAGLMTEWRAFATVAVKCLGMPVEAMPLFNDNQNQKFQKKAEKIFAFILKGGEWQKWKDTFAVARIFPVSTFRFLPGILLSVTWLKVKERARASLVKD